MSRLPVIVGFGGFNAAGRSSFHHGYRRMVIENLPEALRQETLVGLAALMKLVSYVDGQYRDAAGNIYDAARIEATFADKILGSTLIRRIELFDDTAVPVHQKLEMSGAAGQTFSFYLPAKQLPKPLPPSWSVAVPEADTEDAGQARSKGGAVLVTVSSTLKTMIEVERDISVKSAGQLPTGFDPADHYSSRFHPRGLQMAITAASDAINSIGIGWESIADAVAPDEIGVYASSAMSQLDENGNGGMMQARLKGERVTAKQLPLGLNAMPADFVNAYVLGSIGVTGAMTGACATFLYNLRLAVEDIQSGRRRVVVVGCSEAPILPEVIEGYTTMGALASVDNLKKLDNTDEPDYRRSSRPFGENCGFTLSEAAQYVVLMDDALVMQLGADIHAAVTDVFVHADGFKKSISGPGAGNYITMAKAVASARAMLGDVAVRERSFVQAHGSSTPQNRVTESLIFDCVARHFGIEQWPVTAVKAYVGHPLAPASGDQLMSTLGVFKYGIIPGIKTIDRVADDVYGERLLISNRDLVEEPGRRDVSFLNSKGFGGNNASAVVIAPHVVEIMLKKRHGESAFQSYLELRQGVRQKAKAYDESASRGNLMTIYRFGENLIDESAIAIEKDQLSLPGYAHPISLAMQNRYADMV
ncbi:MAG: beta-ketoacyl synthase [Sterolibacterium sp.]